VKIKYAIPRLAPKARANYSLIEARRNSFVLIATAVSCYSEAPV
jgi:hypothetical protein